MLNSFILLNLLSVAVPIAASPFRVLWQHDVLGDGSKAVSINVLNSANSAQYIERAICTSLESQYVIDSGSFSGKPITMTVEPENGFGGEIAWGDLTSPLSDSMESTNGVACKRAYSSKSAVIECTFPSDDGLETFPVDHGGCESKAFDSLLRDEHSNSVKRSKQRRAGGTTEPGKPLNPKNIFVFKQVTGNTNCGKASGCSVTVANGKSESFSFHADITPFKWINAGFSVSPHDTSETESHTCNGKKGEKICIALRKGYKAYNVKNCQQKNACSGNFRLESPLDNDPAETICHVGSQCHAKGYTNY